MRFVKGHIMPREIRAKISKSMKGRSVSKEVRMKISKSHKGIRPSKESRRKNAESHLGKVPWNKNTRRPEMSGSKHPQWKGGITSANKLARHSIEFRIWREAVFFRDNWIDQKTRKRGGDLHAHHIRNFSEYQELRFAIDNGITLSKKAHKEFHLKYGNRNNTREQIEEFIGRKLDNPVSGNVE